METHSNWLKVSLIVGLLFTAAVGFAFWLLQASDAEGPTYEVRFEQSVGGLLKGSGVTLQGVPVGLVSEVRLDFENPKLVIVRFVLTEDTVLRSGVKASIDRSLFDGSAKLSLSGGTNRDPALAASPGQPFPIVPAEGGGLLGDGPTDLIAKMASNAESISKRLDPAGLRSIEKHLDDLARRSQTWERDADRIAERATRTDRIGALGDQMAKVGSGAEHLRHRLEGSREDVRDNINRRLNDANRTAVSIEDSITRARPGLKQLDDDARHVTEKVRSVREPVRRVRDAATRIKREGLGSTKLPDYVPPPVDRSRTPVRIGRSSR